MAISRVPIKWTENNQALLSLYDFNIFHLEDAHPKLGSNVLIPLKNGSPEHFLRIEADAEGHSINVYEPQLTEMRPTMLDLSGYFGYLQDARDTIQNVAQQSRGTVRGRDLAGRILQSIFNDARERFEHKEVVPVRRALIDLPHPVYFYCVPSVSEKTDLVTGQSVQVRGRRVLCLLPKTIQGALYYGAAETDIPLLAGQVIWLVQWMCTHRIIYSPGQLVDALNGWTKYVTPANMTEVQAIIYQANPLLETEMATRALLP